MSGAIGQEQIAKLPMIVQERRANAERFLDMMSGFPWLRTQTEIGESSWFGFSMVLQPDAGIERAALVEALASHGVECRPIVSGNFARNDMVLRHIDHEIHGSLDQRRGDRRPRTLHREPSLVARYAVRSFGGSSESGPG